jgi:hypothetical protein
MRRLARVLTLAALAARPLFAQQAVDPLSRGLDLERVGRYEESAAVFHLMLSQDPTNALALLGIERVYTQLGRRDSIAAAAARALAADPRNATARQIDVRTARALGGEALAAGAIARWMAAVPESEAPWREMIRTLLALGRTQDAREAIAQARRKLGDPQRLRLELAQVEAADGHWPAAAELLAAVVDSQPELVATAAFNLRAAPESARERVMAVLAARTWGTPTRRVGAELLLGWQQPERAWVLLQQALPSEAAERRNVLVTFADRARAQPDAASRRVAAAVLETLASLSPPAEAAEYRIESARTFAEAGDLAAARRVLRAMAESTSAPADVSSAAAATLVEVEARSGDVADAERLLARSRERIPGSEAQRLGLLVARAWLRAGDLDHAGAALRADSSLAADEVRGWVALYRGDLASARGFLRSGGARGESAEAVERAAILVLLQRVRGDSLPALGRALLLAVRGDTLGASRALADLAHTPLAGGQPELLALAARYAAAAGNDALAQSQWGEIVERYGESPPAPAAMLALARAEAARGESAAAGQRLEALILRYPGSALVPEARRELDQVRNLVPRS